MNSRLEIFFNYYSLYTFFLIVMFHRFSYNISTKNITETGKRFQPHLIMRTTVALWDLDRIGQIINIVSAARQYGNFSA